MRTDGRTDGQTDMTNFVDVIRNLAEASRKQSLSATAQLTLHKA
jgi:hypothetical protein